MHRAAAFVLGAGGSIHVEIVGQGAGPQRGTDVRVPGQGGRAAIAADLGGRQSVGLVVGAKAAMLFGNGNAEKAGEMRILVILGREFCFAVIVGRAACEHGLAELPRGRDDRGLFVAEPERLGIEDRRIETDAVGRRHALADLYRHHAVSRVAVMLAFRKSSSAALKAAGRSRLARWPTPSSSTYFADGI